MKRNKGKILAATYAIAAIVTLGACAYVNNGNLADYRLAAKYSSGRAFEETVHAVQTMSEALEKSVYATDGGMCGQICGEAYANALAAETALSTLPFSTQELEQISGFLNTAGDYAYTLCSQAAEEGFTKEQVETLTQMAATAADMAQTLQELRGSVNDGSVVMDSREVRLQNMGEDSGVEKLSTRLLAYEESFEPLAELKYDGQYGIQKKTVRGRLREEEMRSLAAQYAGVEPSALEDAYEYEGEEGRRSYRSGDTLISVSSAGVESLSQSRLVGESRIEPEKAAQIAEDYLRRLGYTELALQDCQVSGALCRLQFCKVEDDALCLDNTLRVSVALDDGSIYGFNRSDYDAARARVRWDTDQETAQEKLPEGLEAVDCRKVILKSAGERDQACYEFRCVDGDKAVNIYVDAETGKQCRIELSELPTEQKQGDSQPEATPESDESQEAPEPEAGTDNEA